jgi:type I restriction enzyme S subunit
MSRLVTDHLPLLAGAPNGVKKLRELILELAVRGKLVQQDPQDKQAQYSTKTEKHPHAETALDEKRFEIPVGWVWAKFSDVAETRLGKMLDKAKNTGELKPYLRNTNVQWYGFDLTDIKEIRLESHELSEFSVLPGDLLICEGGDPGRCSIWQDDSQEIYFQKALHRARVRQEISPEYLRLCIRADCNSGHIATLCTGATIKHLTGERLAKYVLPIPPFPEQQRIVAKVDELMALCDRLETRQSDAQAAHTRLVDELLGSLLQARDAEDFAECWGRVKESFDVLFTTEQSVDDLKRIFLSLAVTGKLSSSKELGNIGWHTGPFNDLIDPLFPIAYGVLVPGPESAGGIPFVRIADLSISNASAQPEKTISPDVDAKFSRALSAASAN